MFGSFLLRFLGFGMKLFGVMLLLLSFIMAFQDVGAGGVYGGISIVIIFFGLYLSYLSRQTVRIRN